MSTTVLRYDRGLQHLLLPDARFHSFAARGFHWIHSLHHHGLCHTTTALLSLAGSFFRYYTDSLPLSGTGLFFLWRCQNPTIHSHRVTSHPARAKKGKEEEGWTTEKHRNLGISHFRFFSTFPHTTGSSSRRVVTVSSAPAVPKTPS